MKNLSGSSKKVKSQSSQASGVSHKKIAATEKNHDKMKTAKEHGSSKGKGHSVHEEHKLSSKTAGKSGSSSGHLSTHAPGHQVSQTAHKKKASASAVHSSSSSQKAQEAKHSGKLASSALRKLSGQGNSRGEVTADTVCREVACEGLATSGGYCRLHYVKNWKKIKRKELILREKKLNQYIEELVAKYPDKYIEAIRQDLANDKDFAKVIYDLDLDEGVDDFDIEGGESADSLIDTIKRDFDDEGDGF